LTRRDFIVLIPGACTPLCGLLIGGRSAGVAPSLRVRTWADLCPSVIQTSDLQALRQSRARVLIANIAADPTWGPYAQRLGYLDMAELREALRGSGVRTITYIEGVGDCMIYAIALVRRADGTYETHASDARTPRPVRTHWCWGSPELPRGDALSWAGIHASVLGEDFVRPDYTLKAIGLAPPTYPDGRPAIGRVSGARPPLDAELWDACASKDLNGRLRPIFAPAIGLKPGDQSMPGMTDGLYEAVVGRDDVDGVGLRAGDRVWCGLVSVHKDISAPFWRHYARASARAIARAGVDGVWCDNWSPWDNFGYPPILHAFGDWSVRRLCDWFADGAPRSAVTEAGIGDPRAFGVRSALKARSSAMGVKDSADLRDPGWSDARWLDDPLWRLIKAGRQVQARRDLRAFHAALHAGAREGGKRDFAVCANDIPFYGLGWAREGWTDMVHTETTPGWHMGSGTRGIMLPPSGKMAVAYRAALAHQSGRYCAAWYYIDHSNAEHQRKQGLARVLLAEAFANGAFLLCDPAQVRVAGTVQTHAWWNEFVRTREAAFTGRRPVADVGIVFSPDCQLYELAPAGFPDMDRQPHVFGHWGWGTAMLDAHIPYVALPDWRIGATGLRGLRALVAPDVGCLSDAALASIARWVRGGGHLVTTGACGSRHGADGAFERRSRSLLDTLGVRPGSGWASASVGKGSVVCHEAPVGMSYYLQPKDRPTLLAAMRDAVGSPPMLPSVDAPPTVELAAWRRDGDRGFDLDLANTDIRLADDVVIAAPAIRVEARVSWSGTTRATLRSPDPGTRVRCSTVSGRAVIQIDGLVHYASVGLEPG